MISGEWCQRLVYFEWYEFMSAQDWELRILWKTRFSPQSGGLEEVRNGCPMEACLFKRQHLLAPDEHLPTNPGSYSRRKKTALQAGKRQPGNYSSLLVVLKSKQTATWGLEWIPVPMHCSKADSVSWGISTRSTMINSHFIQNGYWKLRWKETKA